MFVVALAGCQNAMQSKSFGPLGPDSWRSALTGAQGSISASPSVCEIPLGGSLCSTTITWTTSQASDVKVMIEGHTFAAAASGSQQAPWIGEKPAEFELWGDGILLGRVTAIGTRQVSAGPSGKLTATPASCVVDAKTGLCSVTVGWTSTKAAKVEVKISGFLFAAGLAGSSVAPWIGEAPAKFELYGDDKLLDTLVVTGTKPGVRPPVNPAHCQATDASSLRACFSGLLQYKYTGIAIKNDINCSGAGACNMVFNGFNGPAIIYGYSAGGENVKLNHLDHFDQAMVAIFNSHNIEYRDIDFVEGAQNKPAGQFKTPGYDRNLSCDVEPAKCASPITILFDSSHLTFDHISILEAKGQGIEVGNSSDVTIRNSLIRHAWANGIWSTNGLNTVVPNEHVPNNFVIENNTIIDNRCSGIEISAMGNSRVTGNYLSHNHMGSIYHVPGGQFAIEANTTSLLIKNNEIADGRIDEDPILAAQGWFTVAIEFTDSNVRGVTIEKNYIHHNSGGGIIHDPNPHGPRVNFGPITATDNVFNNPKADFHNWDSGELIQARNCSGPQCQYVP